ncbi:hypothetical protein BDN72DRAFT_848201 [Pluteus cervinus]|uniref:Uncharacterized protein n=1 Tax=Pluteus cervinus TaxID=181527 RepID=A0ACD3ABV4_9AGAR|nr:hypothetical protein BDN72DRAFT_848201 [Pluteus cervinus]
MSLLSCPPDILFRLFTHLDGYSLMRCREICRRFNELISEDVYSQYSLALYRSCMVDDLDTHPTLDISDRLNHLQSFLSRRSSWHTTGPDLTIPLPASSSTRPLDWEYSSGLLVSLPTMRSVRSIDVMASTPGAIREMEVESGEIDERSDYTEHVVDHSQDLLVVAAFKSLSPTHQESGFYVLSLSSGGPHPEAARSYTRLPYEVGTFLCLHVDVYEDFVLVCDSIDRSWWGGDIYVYNWKTGETTAHIRDIPDIGFIFLDRDHLIGCSMNHTESSVQLRVVSLKTSRCVLILPFPELKHHNPLNFGIKSFSGTSRVPLHPNRRNPFHSSPDDTIISLQVQEPNKWCFLCVFPKSSILELLTTMEELLPRAPRIIEWGTWPQSTFELPSPSPTRSHGSRLVIVLPNFNQIGIFDYPPRWFMREMKAVENGGVFAQPIMTIPPSQPSQEIHLEMNGGDWNLYFEEDLFVVGSFREGNHYVFKA